MDYEQVSKVLAQLGSDAGIPVYRTEESTEPATALYVTPTAWFIASGFPGEGQLNIGVYEGDDLRLVGTNQIAFEDLTPACLCELVIIAILYHHLTHGSPNL